MRGLLNKDNVKVMNAQLGTPAVLKREGYIFEPKMDGYRALCYVDRNLTFISRNDIDLTARYPELSFRDCIEAKTCILDGEIVAYDPQGRPRFALLQQGKPAYYVVFDILMKEGSDLTKLPLKERKEILAHTVRDGHHIQTIPFTTDGPALWEYVVALDLEGVMAKKWEDTYYQGTRSDTWLKIKRHNTIDCVIIGYTHTKRAISSLVLGQYDTESHLYYVSKVGTGFSSEQLEHLYAILKPLVQEEPPLFANRNMRDIPMHAIQWVQPVYVCEVSYQEITPQGALRVPVFIRLRDDKKAYQCVQ